MSIWLQFEDRLKYYAPPSTQWEPATTEPRFGSPQLVMPRLGQGSFRVLVTDAYNRRCALTNSPVLHVLDAAHIKPYTEGGPHSIGNGILFRQDVHTLFDRGYITLTPDHRLEVSRRIREEFNNGHEYYAAHGKPISLPKSINFHPAKEFLEWHNENIYLS